MAKTDIWMPWYIGDYLADTARLNTLGHGCYLLIIADYWISGPPNDDDDDLAAIARLSISEWKKIRPKLERFFQIKDGKWNHKRIEEELARAKKNTAERSKSGSKGAAKRWENHNDGDGKTIANAIDTPMANESQNDAPSPSPSPTELLTNETSDLTTVAEKDACGLGCPERAGIITLHLRRMGIKAFSTSEEITEWAKQNVSLDVIDEAIQIARAQLKDEQFSSKYLEKIIARLLNPKPKKNGEAAWWTSEKGIEAKAREVNCWPARAGESYSQLSNRIREKMEETRRESH